MAQHEAPEHHYHLVNPSPWPALGALSGFVLAFGAIFYMHPDMLGVDMGLLSLVPGFCCFWRPCSSGGAM